jgi:hypothetical protein
VSKAALLPRMAAIAGAGIFEDIVPVSALTGEGLDILLPVLRRHLPEGEDLFPATAVTNSDTKTRAAELIREKFLERTREEIPYGLGVFVEEIRRDEAKDLTVIKATVVVDRDSHKRPARRPASSSNRHSADGSIWSFSSRPGRAGARIPASWTRSRADVLTGAPCPVNSPVQSTGETWTTRRGARPALPSRREHAGSSSRRSPCRS